MQGALIGQYRIGRKLGEGGMGAVYVAEHTLLGRKAAIKVLLPELSNNQSIVQRFFNEARAVTAIADPGIVQVFDFGHHTDGSAYIVMEMLDGEALDGRLRRLGRLAPADAVRLMTQISASLAAAHAKGVVHRDLKPENIFIVPDPAVTGGERTKILDFGIAKLHGDEPGRMKTRTGMVMGTPVYMSPEQCRGASNLDLRSDVYALGCVLFTMVCGQPPFDGNASGDLIVAHIRDTPPRPTSLVPSLPLTLEAIILRCLEKDPNARFQSTTELAAALLGVEAEMYGLTPDSAATPAFGAYKRMLTPSVTPSASNRSGSDAPAVQSGAAWSVPTTLSSAAAHVSTPPSSRRKVPLLVGLGVAVAVGTAAAVMLVGRSRNASTLEAAESPPSAATQSIEPVPAVTPVLPDAGVVVHAVADAAVVPDIITAAPVDAGTGSAAATTVIKASRAKDVKTTPKTRRTDSRRNEEQGKTNGTQTGSGTYKIDRGD